MNVTVIGSGSWGTALSILLARNGHDVSLLGRDPDARDSMAVSHENMRYLPGFVFPPEVTFGLLGEDQPAADMLVLAIPSGALRSVVSKLQRSYPLVVVAAKGLEHGTGDLLTMVAKEAMPDAQVGVLSGPNLAVEIVRGIPTAAVAAFKDRAAAEKTQAAFMTRTYRVYISSDVIGVELAGALKNVLAIGAGMSDGLGFGDNTKGAVLARGLGEMSLLGAALGARAETFMGLAGVGDLFATASSTLSRNYRVGRMVGEGLTLSEALDQVGQVAEGVSTAESATLLARRNGIQMPVFEAIDTVLRGRMTPMQGVTALMERTPKAECDF